MGSDILIVADDLTGAADCGIACTRQGLDTMVMLEEIGDGPVADVLAIDANTRHMPPGLAATETARIVRAFGRASGQILFKKIDSTLRGNIGAEVAAALEVRRCADPSAVIVMAPAFPATGRTTVRGRQWLNGAPLEETEFGTCQGIASDSDVPRILEAAGLRTALIMLDVVRGSHLQTVLRDRAARHDALVCDAETDEDLRAIAMAAMSLGRPTVWAGSAGLARCLPEAAGLSRNPRPGVTPCAQGPIVFVVGSPSRVSREQAEVVACEPGVVVVTCQQSAVLCEALDSGHDVLVLPDEAQEARWLAPYAPRIGGLVLTGGDTARAVLQALNVRSLRLIKEVEPGVPLAIAFTSRPLPVITKAGAFGDPNTLTRCRAALRSC